MNCRPAQALTANDLWRIAKSRMPEALGHTRPHHWFGRPGIAPLRPINYRCRREIPPVNHSFMIFG
jgi:hypothetical protein